MAVIFDQAALELRARRRADMETSTFIGSAECTEYVDRAWTEFYLKVAAEFEDICVLGPNSVTMSANQVSYALNITTLLKVKAVLLCGPDNRSLHFLSPVTSPLELGKEIFGGTRTGRPTRYWLHGLPDSTPMQMYFWPPPDAAYIAQVFYIPNLELASVGSAGFPGLSFLAGWDEYIVVSAAMKMKDKEESDCTVLMAEKNQIWDSIKKSLTPLDESMPKYVLMHGELAARGRNDFYADPFDAESF